MTTTHLTRWMLDSLAEGTYKVVRITQTVETLAVPFTSVRQAEKWITDHAGQLDLFSDDNQADLFIDG